MTEAKLILIIDDDKVDRELLKETILDFSPRIIIQEAENGDIAMKALQLKQNLLPDSIFLDLNMPRKNGKAVLLELKNSCRFKDIPGIIFSTSNDPQDKNETLILGAISFITKPCNYKEWPKKIKEALKQIDSNSFC